MNFFAKLRGGGSSRGSDQVEKIKNSNESNKYDDHYYTSYEEKQIEKAKAEKELAKRKKKRTKKKKRNKKDKGNGMHPSSHTFEDSSSDSSSYGTEGNGRYKGKIRWRRGELLGSGAYGNVYLGLNQDTGELMGAKVIQMVNLQSHDVSGQIRALQTEISLMKGLDHPNIVRYWGSELDRRNKTLTIFMEYVSGGSVSALLKKFGNLNERVVRLYTKQILSGLDYLHSNRIMHRDVKGANILVDHLGVCKLADFGASKRLDLLTVAGPGEHSLRGTPYWMAPEVVKQTGHGRQADIWSVGCTVIEMATGKPPFSNFTTHVAVLFHIAVSKEPPPFPPNLSEVGAEFLSMCFRHEPRERPSARSLLRHPFILEEGPALNDTKEKNKNLSVNIESSGNSVEESSWEGHDQRQELPFYQGLDASAEEDSDEEYPSLSSPRTTDHKTQGYGWKTVTNGKTHGEWRESQPSGGSHRKKKSSPKDSLKSNFEWNEKSVSASNDVNIGMNQSPRNGTNPEKEGSVESHGHLNQRGRIDSVEDEEALSILASHLGLDMYDEYDSEDDSDNGWTQVGKDGRHRIDQVDDDAPSSRNNVGIGGGLGRKSSRIAIAPNVKIDSAAKHESSSVNLSPKSTDFNIEPSLDKQIRLSPSITKLNKSKAPRSGSEPEFVLADNLQQLREAKDKIVAMHPVRASSVDKSIVHRPPQIFGDDQALFNDSPREKGIAFIPLKSVHLKDDISRKNFAENDVFGTPSHKELGNSPASPLSPSSIIKNSRKSSKKVSKRKRKKEKANKTS
jgi:serine/threonine protein kinase